MATPLGMLNQDSLVGKPILEVGWAGPILWVVASEKLHIHLYDAPITLDGECVSAGDELDSRLVGQSISEVCADGQKFSVRTASGLDLCVGRTEDESARVFRKGDLSSHVIYSAGEMSQDL